MNVNRMILLFLFGLTFAQYFATAEGTSDIVHCQVNQPFTYTIPNYVVGAQDYVECNVRLPFTKLMFDPAAGTLSGQINMGGLFYLDVLFHPPGTPAVRRVHRITVEVAGGSGPPVGYDIAVVGRQGDFAEFDPGYYILGETPMTLSFTGMPTGIVYHQDSTFFTIASDFVGSFTGNFTVTNASGSAEHKFFGGIYTDSGFPTLFGEFNLTATAGDSFQYSPAVATPTGFGQDVVIDSETLPRGLVYFHRAAGGGTILGAAMDPGTFQINMTPSNFRGNGQTVVLNLTVNPLSGGNTTAKVSFSDSLGQSDRGIIGVVTTTSFSAKATVDLSPFSDFQLNSDTSVKVVFGAAAFSGTMMEATKFSPTKSAQFDFITTDLKEREVKSGALKIQLKKTSLSLTYSDKYTLAEGVAFRSLRAQSLIGRDVPALSEAIPVFIQIGETIVNISVPTTGSSKLKTKGANTDTPIVLTTCKLKGKN